MTTEDPDIIVLANFRGHWETQTYPGGRMVRADCDHLAWLSPPGAEFFSRDGVVSRCHDCYEQSDIDPASLRIVPGAVDALQEQFGDEMARRARALLKRRGIVELQDE